MRRLVIFILFVLPGLVAHSQNARQSALSEQLREWKKANEGKTHQELFDEFASHKASDFASFTRQKELAFNAFLDSAWVHFEGIAPVQAPVLVNPNEVIHVPEGTQASTNAVEVQIDTIITENSPSIENDAFYFLEFPGDVIGSVEFELYGSVFSVSVDVGAIPRLRNISSAELSRVWKEYMNLEQLYKTQMDCLCWRNVMEMGDWMYLQFLDKFAETVFGPDRNDSVLLRCFLLMASDLDFRLAKNGDSLYCLVHPDCNVYGFASFVINEKKYYLLEEVPLSSLEILDVSDGGLQALHFFDAKPGVLAEGDISTHTVVSKAYPDMKVEVRVNKGLIDYYSSYPVTYTESPFTKWIPYVRGNVYSDGFYEGLRPLLAGKSQYEAVSMILNMMQTGFEYEEDDTIWGHDRVFFPDETLYYSYSDCEDRAILFARCVRDLLDMDSILVYYPGHLAAAVQFSEDSVGESLMIDGKRYTVCDPVYIGAPVGMSLYSGEQVAATAIKF